MIEKNGVTPREIFKHNGREYWFKCENGHEFKSVLKSITSYNCWCPRCKNKTEKKFLATLTAEGIVVDTQPRFSWCKRKRVLPFDFRVGKWIIEIDGGQHFWDVKGWRSKCDDVSNTDVFKMQCAIKNGYSVVRMSQQEIFDNSWGWKTAIISTIQENVDVPTVIYLSNDPDLYNVHRVKMDL
jgi:very-short-patch-repair endonuclease